MVEMAEGVAADCMQQGWRRGILTTGNSGLNHRAVQYQEHAIPGTCNTRNMQVVSCWWPLTPHEIKLIGIFYHIMFTTPSCLLPITGELLSQHSTYLHIPPPVTAPGIEGSQNLQFNVALSGIDTCTISVTLAKVNEGYGGRMDSARAIPSRRLHNNFPPISDGRRRVTLKYHKAKSYWQVICIHTYMHCPPLAGRAERSHRGGLELVERKSSRTIHVI